MGWHEATCRLSAASPYLCNSTEFFSCISVFLQCVSQVYFSRKRGWHEATCRLSAASPYLCFSTEFLSCISVFLKCVSQEYFSRRKRGWDAATWRLGAASPHLPPGLGILQALPGSLQFSLSGAAASNQGYSSLRHDHLSDLDSS